MFCQEQVASWIALFRRVNTYHLHENNFDVELLSVPGLFRVLNGSSTK